VNATCLEVLEQNNCGQPWIQNVSTSEITDGATRVAQLLRTLFIRVLILTFDGHTCTSRNPDL